MRQTIRKLLGPIAPYNLYAIGAFVVMLSGQMAFAQSVTEYELRDHIDRPCSVSIQTDADVRISLQLSDYQNTWSLLFWVTNRPREYRQFFDARGLRNNRAVESTYRNVNIGSEVFSIEEVEFYDLRESELDENSTAMFSIVLRHNVVG